MKHTSESVLALYAAGDLALWRRATVALHGSHCERCRMHVDAYRADRERRLEIADRLPEDLDWESLSQEMAANIRVGLAAGECVADVPRSRGLRVPGLTGSVLSGSWLRTWMAEFNWRPAGVVAGVMLVLAGAWWLNMPAADNVSLGKSLRAIARGGQDRLPQFVRGARAMDDRSPVVEVTSSGVQVRENGGALGVGQGTLRPVAVSVSVQGSASAHYVDNDTGQVTITSVYVE